MTNPQRGSKHTCQNDDCLKRFYDLGKMDFACPSCSTPFDTERERIALTEGNAGGYVPVSRRKRPVFRIVSPDTAEQLAREAASATLDEPASDGKQLLDMDSKS
ncbi:MAG TPA: FYDLN acid domain-containing protein [Hyphomicrobiaceae bacterium]|nr:FYDLN acid domain-containing protein [Hyphomicrobiaceae bacterium]